jgi:osmotically-inducible protein OsmY
MTTPRTPHSAAAATAAAAPRAPWRLATTLVLAAAALAGATGCAPLLVGGAVLGSGLVATDRRTTGTQVEDQSIELKAASRVRDLATLGNVSVVSYNRMLLITGEVPGETEKAAVGAALARIENVRSVVNELGIGQNASVGSRGTDTLIEAKVKAALVDAKDLHANAYKVVSERGIVYLMGRVSEREAARGAEVARAVGGVQKVVRVFEILSDDELANLGKTTAAPVAPPAPANAPR